MEPPSGGFFIFNQQGLNMNIDNMTYGELKQIAELFGNTKQQTQNKPHPFIGKYVIARCYAAGVHAGFVESVDGENVTLNDSVRLWSWKAKDGVALSGVAQNGLSKDKSKLDSENPVIYLTGVCELIPVSDKAKESIRG
jgi:hypothetical protein